MSPAIRLLNFRVARFNWLRIVFRGDGFRIAKPPTRDWDPNPLHKLSNPISGLYSILLVCPAYTALIILGLRDLSRQPQFLNTLMPTWWKLVCLLLCDLAYPKMCL